MRERVIRFLYFDKSKEGSSPYGRDLGILANGDVCLRRQQLAMSSINLVVLISVRFVTQSDHISTLEHNLETSRTHTTKRCHPWRQ